MRSLSSLGLGLSLVFGFLLLALLAELYYLLWWKKRFINNNNGGTVDQDYHSGSSARELFYLLCWKQQCQPSSMMTTTVLSPQQLCNSSVRLTTTNGHLGHESVEAELMRVHNLSGPPRLLFTIREETKEDLESEDQGKSRKGSRDRSLSDLLVKVETPFFTPMSSPPYFTPPLTPLSLNGFNPLFDSSNDCQLKFGKPSPPPMFKFLRDAEEKLLRRKLMEENQSVVDGDFVMKAQSSSMV
ncbi:hypothetical protein Scep_003212 [Stephania cephalantha]|uniref:Uncharacterized protein n=1 Tax=Stephania cephalantha TaxID=152367 RepID=A0AAP0PU82_9MAGN